MPELMDGPAIFVISGMQGAGKSTIAQLLAQDDRALRLYLSTDKLPRSWSSPVSNGRNCCE